MKKYAIWLGYNAKGKAVYFNGFNPDGTYKKEYIKEEKGEIPSYTCGKTVATRISIMINNGFTLGWRNKATVTEAKDYSRN